MRTLAEKIAALVRKLGLRSDLTLSEALDIGEAWSRALTAGPARLGVGVRLHAVRRTAGCRGAQRGRCVTAIP